MNRLSQPIRVKRHQSIESNPFRTGAVHPGAIEYRHEPGQCDDVPLISRLVDSFLRTRSGQIMGDHGTGKSTLVSSLLNPLQASFDRTEHLCFAKPSHCKSRVAKRLETLRHCRSVSQQLRQALAGCSANTLLIIDGAEQLSYFAYWQLVRSIARKEIAVLATSHQKLWRMPVLCETKISAEMIGTLTREKVRQSSEVVRNLVEADLLSRDLNAIGNVRDYWFELYDLVQPQLQACDSYREVQYARREVQHAHREVQHAHREVQHAHREVQHG